MLNIEQELEKYKVSKSFIEDCESLKSEFIIKKGYMPNDLEIEKTALEEKTKALLIRKECEEKGHVFSDEDEEVIFGEIWVCCQRCGEWLKKS